MIDRKGKQLPLKGKGTAGSQVKGTRMAGDLLPASNAGRRVTKP